MTIKHLYPSQRPSLDLNFARTKRLDPRVDFERFSVGTYVGNDGLIKTAVDHEPRFDHDPVTGESLGLLIEEDRTNLVDNSIPIDFSFYEWRTIDGTNTANSATSPDGSSTAAKFVSTSGQTNIRQYIPQTAVVSGNTYVASLFVKANPYSYFVVSKTGASDISGTQSSTFNVRFDLNAGTTDGLGSTDSWIEDYGNGWYRCSAAFIANSNTNAVIIFYPKNSSYDSLTGDGVSGFYFWGGVIEAGSFPTSYIPTSGSTVTRAADVTSITGNNFSSWYNQDEGTFYSKGDLTYSYSGSTTFRAILVGGTFPSRRWSWATIEGTNRISAATDGMEHANFYTNMSRNIPNNFNIAQAIKNTATTNVSSAADGVIKGSLTGFSSHTISSILIGHNSFTGHISRLTYYPTRLSDTILQNLTL